jgi:hypothetical protein
MNELYTFVLLLLESLLVLAVLFIERIAGQTHFLKFTLVVFELLLKLVIAFCKLLDLNLVVEVCGNLPLGIFQQNPKILNLDG